jgi:zinc transporter ZupT
MARAPYTANVQGFAAGLMLSISFLDLAHNALNSIGFLKANLWVSQILLETVDPCQRILLYLR